MTEVDDQPWSHNAHYHRVVLGAVPPGCVRALDLGCGQGALTRRLRRVVPHVSGIDRDRRSVELARAHREAGDISYLEADFLAAPFRRQSLDLITSVASLHHVDAETALRRTAELLRPGGVLVVIGLANDTLPMCLRWEIPAVIGSWPRRAWSASRRRIRRQRRPPASSYQSPVIWPPPLSYRNMRELGERVLPGCRFRRRLYWRYSLIWTKP
jgi:SAM-dependent methyltransferase